MPEGFDHVEFRHRMRMEQPTSGSLYLDDLFFRELPAGTDARWETLLSFGSTWNYSATPQAPGWQTSAFLSPDWQRGQAKFGAGSGPRAVKTPLPQARSSYYFRTELNLHRSGYDELLLVATCTDDYADRRYPIRVWINGVEVVSSGIEVGSGDGNGEKYFDLRPYQHGTTSPSTFPSAPSRPLNLVIP
jgi:hypothetical protein